MLARAASERKREETEDALRKACRGIEKMMDLNVMLSGEHEFIGMKDGLRRVGTKALAGARPRPTKTRAIRVMRGAVADTDRMRGLEYALEDVTVPGVVKTVKWSEMRQVGWALGTRPRGRFGQFVTTRAGNTFQHDVL